MVKRAIIFLRRHAAHGIGHVGWAFLEEKDTFNAGAIENPLGTLRTLPANMGFWTKRTRNPIKPMRTRRYDEFKVIELAQADPAYARRVVAWVRQQPYEIVHQNCMDATYDVLRAYGLTNLPVPAHHWEPNHWFDSIQGEHYRIDGKGVAVEDDHVHPIIIGAVEPDEESFEISSSSEPPAEEPTVPTWRIPHTPEGIAFQAAMLTAPPMPAHKRYGRGPALQLNPDRAWGWSKVSLSFVLCLIILIVLLIDYD